MNAKRQRYLLLLVVSLLSFPAHLVVSLFRRCGLKKRVGREKKKTKGIHLLFDTPPHFHRKQFTRIFSCCRTVFFFFLLFLDRAYQLFRGLSFFVFFSQIFGRHFSGGVAFSSLSISREQHFTTKKKKAVFLPHPAMDALMLPLAPGSTTAILHPINVFGASWAILRHALRSLNPDTAIVRRTHHSRSRGAATESRAADTASIASSRATRQSNASAAMAGATGSGTRRHHRHRTPSQKSESAGDGTAAVMPPSSSSSARRTRSAEEPLAAARRAAASASYNGDSAVAGGIGVGDAEAPGHRVRRSHSDGVRGRTRRRDPNNASADGSGSDAITPRLSAPHPLSSAAAAAAASGLTPPLAPPPSTSRPLGKPPLSSRHRSASSTADGEAGAGTAAAASSSRHRHHRSGSGSGGLSSSSGGRSSRGRRVAEDEESNEGSVIVIRDGAGISLGSVTAGWPLLSSLTAAKPGTSFSWSPRTWWGRLRTEKVTQSALLMNHVLHAVPVMLVHYCCELKCQLVTLPLLRFSDLYVKFAPAKGCASSRPPDVAAAADGKHRSHAAAAATLATSSTHHDTEVVTADWPPTEEAFEKSSASTAAHLLLMRWMLQAVDSYIEKLFFLDETLVVRQLRSKRTLRRVVGWTLRLVSHTVFDPFLLSIVVPMLLSPPSCSTASSAEVPRVLFTVPGMIRGLGISAASVVVQHVVMPTASRLVYRAVLTAFEVVEYLMMRRYAHWSDEEDNEDDDFEVDDGASIASGTSGATSIAASGGVGGGESRSVSQQSTGSATAEERTRREQRHLRHERRERRRRREQRQAARDQATRRAILRAIVYRVVSSVVAQSVVDHPLRVVVELLRGRATLHLTGMLTPYAGMTAAQDGLSWAQVWRYAASLTEPVASGVDDYDGVPPAVVALRRAGRDAAHELWVISSSVLDNSGQRAALAAVEQRAADKRAQGEVTSATDSAEFLMRSALSLSPFYYGLQFTVIDKVLTFYMAVWTRLTKQ